MTKLPVVSSDDAIRALKKAGFVYAPRRGKGSHVALYRLDPHGRHQLVIVPKRKELPRGTLWPSICTVSPNRLAARSLHRQRSRQSKTVPQFA